MQERRKKKSRVFGSRSLRRRRLLVAAIALTLIAIALGLFLWGRGAGWFDKKELSPTPGATTDAPTPGANEPTPEAGEPTPDQVVPANPMVGRAIARASTDSDGMQATQTGAPGSTSMPGASLSPAPDPSASPDASVPPAVSASPGAFTPPAVSASPGAFTSPAVSASPGAFASPSPSAEPEAKGPLDGVKIGIDPGHQAKANSAQEPVAPGSSETKAKVSSGTAGVATRVAEYVVNLDVSLQLRDALEALGAQVYLTRETHEVDISNIERAQMMNEYGVDLVLRIHCNGSEDRSVHGISLFVKPSGTGAAESLLAAQALLPAMVAATDAKSLGIFQRDTYSGLNWSEVPSILVEMGFMSNREEDALLNDPAYQQKLVGGMVRGIADYLGRPLEGTGESDESPDPQAAQPSSGPAGE